MSVPVPPPPSDWIDRKALCQEFLGNEEWPSGLIETMIRVIHEIPYRVMIVDDSGSMSASDGNMLVGARGGKQKMVTCTRWKELCAAMEFHAEFSEMARVPTEFRMLNGPTFVIGEGNDDGEAKKNF